MKNMKKGILFFGAVVVAIVLVSSATGLNTIQTTQPNKTTKSEPALLLFNQIHVTAWAYGPHMYLRFPGELIKCQDLNTGAVKYATTNLFGNCAFLLLTAHHNYKISDTQPPYHYKIVYNLVGIVHIDLYLD